MVRKPKTEAEPVVEAPAVPDGIVTNDKPGTTLHLGDGRKLAFGESADVGIDVARQIRACQ